MTARILVVDDVPTNVRLLEAGLASEYYEVKSIQDSADVLRTADHWQPDVILLDVMMPGMDGYQICRLLKGNSSTAHIPVIMVTALKEVPDRLQALASGADEFVTKPIEYEVLMARLRSTIRLKHLLDEWQHRGATALALGIGPDAREVSLESSRALVVDDLTSRALRLRAVLSRNQITTALAAHEEAALQAVRNTAFDLIAISLSLLSSDPLRLVAKLRAEAATRDTPLLLVAEPDQRQLVINGLDLGANDCIMLPLDEAELLLRAGNHIRRKHFQDRLRTNISSALQLAVIDPLTELYNRRYLMDHLDRLCADSSNFAVLMIDVDHFKSVNDSHGHYAGDRVLQTVAQTLRHNVREIDLVARYGGEEFVVVIRELRNEVNAIAAAEKLRYAIEHMPIEPRLGVTISVGIAMAGAGANAVALIEQADKALYEAKRFGRNQVTMQAELPNVTAPPPRSD